MNETVAAAAKMLLALLDLDFLGLRGAASDAGIVLSVTGIVSVAVNRNVAEEFVWSFYAVLLLCLILGFRLPRVSYEKNARGTHLHT